MGSINTGGMYPFSNNDKKQLLTKQKRMMDLPDEERKAILKAAREQKQPKVEVTSQKEINTTASQGKYPTNPDPFGDVVREAQQNAKDSYDRMTPSERRSYPLDTPVLKSVMKDHRKFSPPIWTQGLEDEDISRITIKEPPTELFNELA